MFGEYIGNKIFKRFEVDSCSRGLYYTFNIKYIKTEYTLTESLGPTRTTDNSGQQLMIHKTLVTAHTLYYQMHDKELLDIMDMSVDKMIHLSQQISWGHLYNKSRYLRTTLKIGNVI